MKKLLLLIALMIGFGAVWNATQARYVIGDRKAYNEIMPGDTIAIQGVNNGDASPWFSLAKLQSSFNDECVYIAEAGPADIRTDAATIMLRNISTNLYYGMSTTRNDKAFITSSQKMVATTDSAFTFEVVCAADYASPYGNNMEENSVMFSQSFDWYGELYYYYMLNYAYWGDESVFFYDASYNAYGTWNVFAIHEEENAKGNLQDKVNFYDALGDNFVSGTNPGNFDASAIDAYNLAKIAAESGLTQDLSDEEYNRLGSELDEAYAALQASFVALESGYYYIVSNNEKFMEVQSVEKAIYAESETSPGWKTFDKNDISFVWKIEPKGGQWSMYSPLYDSYMHGTATYDYGYGINMQKTTDRSIYFNYKKDGEWEIADSYGRMAFYADDYDNGITESGHLLTWVFIAKGLSSWVIRKVEDQDVIDAAYAQQAQYKLQDELSSLIVNANNLYDKLFVVSADASSPMISKADDEGANQFLYNRKEDAYGNYKCLIDGITDSDGTDEEHGYFHGSYYAPVNVGAHTNDEYDFMQVDLSEAPISSFVLRYAKRYGTNYGRPTRIAIYAANDTTGFYAGTDTEWTKITTIYPNTNNGASYQSLVYTSPFIDLGAEYKYVRFVFEATNTDTRYATFSEFQLYPGSVSEELSQYYYIEGMQAASDKMFANALASQAYITQNAVTQAHINSLRDDYNEVLALYADTTALKSLISHTANIASYALVGPSIGQAKTQEDIDALQNAVEAAKALNFTDGQLNKDEIDGAYNTLNSALTAYLKGLNVPQANTWYYLKNLDATIPEGDATNLNGAMMLVSYYGDKVDLTWGIDTDDQLIYDPMAMWAFIPVEDDYYPLAYYVQNLASGNFLGDYSTYSKAIKTSSTPVVYQLDIVGGQPALLARRGSNPGYYLTAEVVDEANKIVGWSGGANTPAAWDMVAVDPEEIEAITTYVVNNTIDVFVAPYDMAGVAELNDCVTLYGIKNMTYDADANKTTVELYEKDEFAAGEACIMVVGDPASDEEYDYIELIIPLPTTIAQKPVEANGIVGTFVDMTVPAGLAWSNGKKFSVGNAQDVMACTGYIDPSYFKSKVEGVETALTIEIEGLVDDLSAVGPVTTETHAKAKGIFSLDGKRVTNPEKGKIYIINSKLYKY